MMKKYNFAVFLVMVLVLVLPLHHVAQNDYYLQSGANITSLSSWGTNTNGSGSNPPDFVSGDNWWITSNATLSAAWNLDAGATINVGDGSSTNTLVIATGGSIPNNPLMNVNNSAGFDMETSFALATNISPQVGSTVIFGTNSPSLIVLGAPYYNVVVTANNQINGSINVDGTLTINAAVTLTINANSCEIAAIAGSGQFDSGSGVVNANLTVNGTGGTLNMKAGAKLNQLKISLSPATSSLTLGSSLLVTTGGTTPQFSLAAGVLVLGSNSFTCNTLMTPLTGSIAGTGSSTLILSGGAVNMTGSLKMASSSNSLSTLTINRTGRTLILSNTLNIMDLVRVSAGTLASGGFLNLAASNGRVANVGNSAGTGIITGNVTVNSFFPSGTTGWCLLGSNGVLGQTISNMQNNFFVTCQDCNYLPSAVGNFTSVQGYDESTCTYVTNTSTNSSLAPGVGYWVYLGTNSGTSANMNWSYTGVLQMGNISVNTTAAGGCGNQGFNLVANPYPSAISWTNLYNNGANSGNFGDIVYTYKRSGVAATYQVGVGGTGGGTDAIPPGQGFFVQNAAFLPAALDFVESVKTTVNSTNLSKNASGSVKTELNNINAFRLMVLGAYDEDDAIFVIKPTSTINYDKKGDGLKLFSNPNGIYNPKYTSISSKDPNGVDLAINSFPALSNSVSIPVLVKVSSSGTYTLQARDFDNYQSCVVIKDKKTGIITDLKIKDYTFNISDTTSTPRFELLVCANGAGPVSVAEFFASSNLSINQVAEGLVVKTNYSDNTKSVVSVYNIIGQKIMDDITIEGKQSVHLNIADKNQVVLIKVVNDKESLTKKVLMH